MTTSLDPLTEQAARAAGGMVVVLEGVAREALSINAKLAFAKTISASIRPRDPGGDFEAVSVRMTELATVFGSMDFNKLARDCSAAADAWRTHIATGRTSRG